MDYVVHISAAGRKKLNAERLRTDILFGSVVGTFVAFALFAIAKLLGA